MSKDELNEILDSRFKKIGMTIERNARWKIVTPARGLPEYVHALGRASALSALNAGRTTIAEKDVDVGIKETLTQSGQSATAAYKKAIDSNKKMHSIAKCFWHAR
jgi:histone H3/H4